MNDLLDFNLLNWRDARRESRRQDFFKVMAVVGVVSVGVFGFLPHWYYGSIASHKQTKVQYLKGQISKEKQKLHKIHNLKKVRKRIINRMHVIEKLQNARPEIVHYFDQLASTIPNGVYLKSLKQKGDVTTLKGVAKSNGDISTYMSKLSQSKWFKNPKLIVINHHYTHNKKHSDFTLQIKSSHPGNKNKHPKSHHHKGH